MEDFSKELSQDITSGNFKNVYLLTGEEEYLIRQYKHMLLKALIPEEDSVNVNFYEGEDITAKELIDQAETMPFFSDRRLLVVENSSFFKPDPKKKDEKTEAETTAKKATSEKKTSEKKKKEHTESEKLAEYLGEMPDTTYILFVQPQIDKQKALVKAIKKKGRVVEFGRMNNDAITLIILKTLKEENKNITRHAMQRFLEMTGNDMNIISKELEKLICYTLDRDVILPEDVEAICTEQLENNIFKMTDALADSKPKRALEVYYDLLALDEPPMRILYLITGQFDRLLKVKEMRGHGYDVDSITKKLGLNPYASRICVRQSERFAFGTLLRYVQQCAETEEAIKTGNLNDSLGVELLLAQKLPKTPQ